MVKYIPVMDAAPALIPVNMLPRPRAILFRPRKTRYVMRCMVTLKDGDAMERAMGALAKYRYTAGGEPVVPSGHPESGAGGFLRLSSAEFETIRDHVDDGDIVDMKAVNERASSEIH